jgi:hypothetical protein
MILVALALEYEAVALREANRFGLPASIVEAIIHMLVLRSVQPAIRFRLRPALSDPDDGLYWSWQSRVRRIACDV